MLIKASASAFCMLFLAARGNAQEKAAYGLPRSTTNLTYRQNFCQQHARVERGEIELRDALRGLNISVGFFGYQLNQETGAIDEENPDIAVEFLNELAKRAGFEYRNSYGIVDLPTASQTYTQVLDSITDEYDMTGDWFIETTERLEMGILYPEGWQDANYIMVMQADDNTDFDLFAFTKPFTPGVWGLIALMTIISGLCYYVLDYFDSRIKRRPMDVGLESSLFLTAFTFNGHYAHQPKSRSTRILVFSMAFFFLLIVACYTANLASFLVLKNRQVVINDVQDAIKSDLTFCVEGGAAYVDYLRTFRIQPKHLIQLQTPPGDELESATFLGLLEGKCDIVFTAKGIFEQLKRTKRLNPDCNLEFVGRIQKFLSGGFALKDSEQYCASVLRDVLHLHMYEMKGTEVYDTIWENYLNKAATNTCNVDDGDNGEDENYASMGLASLSGMFFLHAIALMIALAVTFVRFCQQPSYRKRAMISELRQGVLGNTTLTRAVFRVTRRSSLFSSRKNNEASSSRGTDGPRIPKIEEETTNNDDRGRGRVAQAGKNLDLADKMEEMMEVMEQKNQQQNQLIEALVQEIGELKKGKFENAGFIGTATQDQTHLSALERRINR